MHPKNQFCGLKDKIFIFKRVMEFELDEYLGLPKGEEFEMYEMQGGGARYMIVPTENALKTDIDSQSLFVVRTTAAKEEYNSLSEIKGEELNATLAVSEQAVSNLLADYFSSWKAPVVAPELKSVLDHLFLEADSELPTLIQDRQFAFLSFVHGLHAEAILQGYENTPVFETDLVDKYVWLANTLEEAKNNDQDTIVGTYTKSVLTDKFNALLKDTLGFNEIVDLFQNPGIFYKYLQKAGKELKSETRSETSQAEPETSQVESENSQAESETSQAEPETSQVESETPQVEPETSQVEPETSQAEPETSQAEPETSQAEPETPQVGSENSQVEPETSQVESETSQAEPETLDEKTYAVQPSEMDKTETDPETPSMTENAVLLNHKKRGGAEPKTAEEYLMDLQNPLTIKSFSK